MGLGAHGKGPAGFAKADVDMDQLALEVQGGHAMTDQFELFGGLRYVSLSGDVDISGPLAGNRHANADQDWVDPFVGARYTIPIGESWSASLRGDVGGFGIGSDFAWQAIALLRWHASDHIDLIGAYRYVDMDYEDGSGSHRFIYDVAISGPALGMSYKF